MTFIGYTSCENGFRHFTCLTGVAISFDKDFIAWLVQSRKDHLAGVEVAMETNKKLAAEQGTPIDPRLEEQNQKIIKEQKSWNRRVQYAEATINGELVRNVVFFDDVNKAIVYSREPPKVEEPTP